MGNTQEMKMTDVLDSIEKLAACPFCGAKEFQIRENNRVWAGTHYTEPTSVSIYHWCDTQEVGFKNFIERKGKTLDDAIASWNRRSQ